MVKGDDDGAPVRDVDLRERIGEHRNAESDTIPKSVTTPAVEMV